MTETLQLLKRFAVTSLLLLCAVAMLCGAAIVDSNTRRLAMGDPGRQVGFSLDKETTTIMTGEQTMTLPPLERALDWLRFAPAPIGTLVMIGETVAGRQYNE